MLPWLRCRLDGVDADWRDEPAHGRLSLIFLDAAGSTVGSSDAKMHGTSEGWRGQPETSPLKAFSLLGVAPPPWRQVFNLPNAAPCPTRCNPVATFESPATGPQKRPADDSLDHAALMALAELCGV